ncbi:MAG TPA: glucokinase [Limnobacter sp.]|nr:glucokinase [Limnobacter sp.]
MTGFALVGDIGGTHARFAMADGVTGELHAVEVFSVARFETLAQALAHYTAVHAPSSLHSACLAVAAPVLGDAVQMTNHHWAFSQSALKAELGLERLDIINDFKAMALGMLVLPHESFDTLQPGEGAPDAPRAVLGPGTGLGTSALVPSGRQWIALSAEGGHVGFAPRDELEAAVWAHLNAQFGRVSVERILSGAGLYQLYCALAALEKQIAVHPNSPALVQAAHAGGAFEQAVLARFCGILGAVAGDLVLALGARGGVYLCGGVLAHLPRGLLKKAFLQGFLAKGRYQAYMTDVPVWLCLAELPALHGAALHLRVSMD